MKVTIDLSDYDDAPLGALSGSRVLICLAGKDPERVEQLIRRGGLEGIGGLHETITWTCLVAEKHSRENRTEVLVALANWRTKLGDHRTPHVVKRDGIVRSITFDDADLSATSAPG